MPDVDTLAERLYREFVEADPNGSNWCPPDAWNNLHDNDPDEHDRWLAVAEEALAVFREALRKML